MKKSYIDSIKWPISAQLSSSILAAPLRGMNRTLSHRPSPFSNQSRMSSLVPRLFSSPVSRRVAGAISLKNLDSWKLMDLSWRAKLEPANCESKWTVMHSCVGNEENVAVIYHGLLQTRVLQTISTLWQSSILYLTTKYKSAITSGFLS